MSKKSEQEQPLTGGNVSAVSRAGDTVRREQKPDSPRIHRLLVHLEKKEYPASPRFLGIDPQNREILSYLDGEAGNYPLKAYMWSEAVLEETARLLRQFHDATADFEVPASWEPLDNTPLPYAVICHNDFAVYNVIFKDKKPIGVIDFDLAAPGPRIWDIAYTLYTFVPLSRHHHDEHGRQVDYDPVTGPDRIKRRIDIFLAAYGMPELKEQLFDTLLLRIEALLLTIHRKAAHGEEAFQWMIEEGHATHYEQELAFIKQHGVTWFD
ncbi:aminoglycoside phosphotransferase family protein [Exiguobacterium sp. s133]|uniref:phosphotransferase enzyme family protein n=1 Tax=Exiguobacterium sp. s133 TaxID=2751213 RepID=UPI001BEC5ED4|nr:aminoglycoside phosphotransferase family protein [Exiguobacterium sp. s133]